MTVKQTISAHTKVHQNTQLFKLCFVDFQQQHSAVPTQHQQHDYLLDNQQGIERP